MNSFATADPAPTDPDATEENQGWTLRLISGANHDSVAVAHRLAP
jgi:hypothetical protein